MRIAGLSTALYFATMGLMTNGVHAESTADSAVRMQTDIPPQSLVSALNLLAQQRDMQVVYRTDVIGTRVTQGAVGHLTTDEAIQQLLTGTGLAYRYVDETTAMIVPAGASAENQDDKTRASEDSQSRLQTQQDSGRNSFWERFRLAQVDQTGTAGQRALEGDDKPEDVRLEEIVVTAQQRKQALYDVPMAITALSGKQVRDRGVGTFQELSFAVPDLRVHQVLPGQNTLALRGIGAAGGSMPLVGVYLDDIAASGPGPRSLDLRTMDLERVEVLHGPQGTLYGQGSAAGTIRFITKDPSVTVPELSAAVDSSFTEGGSPSQKISGVANVPVVDGRFGLRVAGTYESAGGWIDLPAAGKEDINGGELYNVRVKGLLNVTDAVSFTAMAIVHRNEVDSPDGGEDAEGNAYRPPFAPTLEQPTENDYELYALTGNFDFGGFELLTATSYYHNRLDSIYSTPFTTAAGSTNHRHFHEQDDDKVFNQEIRLSSSGDGPLHWTLGTFYRDSEYAQDLLFVRQTNAAGLTTVQDLSVPASDSSKSWSYFANASYEFTDSLEIGAGARYFDDQRINPLSGQRASFDSFDPRVFLTYGIADEIKLYASAAKGFRSGGFNSVTAFRPQYEPDEVHSYETGLKFSGWQSRLSGEVAVYYSEYKDMQLVTPVPGLNLTYLGNVGKAEVMGFDWSLTFAVGDSTTLGTYGTVVEDEVVEIPAGSALRVGDPLNYVADYNYSLFGQRDFSWAPGIEGLFRVEYSEKGAARFIARNQGLMNESGVIGILYARLGASWRHFSLSVYGDNLLDDRDTVAPNIVGFASRPRPRTFGLIATANF